MSTEYRTQADGSPCTDGFVCEKRIVVDPIERNESIALRREQYFTTMSENGFLSESRGRYGRFLADKTSFLLTQRLHVEWTGAIETPVSGNLGDSENKRQAFLTLFQSFACRCQSAGNWGTRVCKLVGKSLLWFGMSEAWNSRNALPINMYSAVHISFLEVEWILPHGRLCESHAIY